MREAVFLAIAVVSALVITALPAWLYERDPLNSGFIFSLILLVTPLGLTVFAWLFLPRGPLRTGALVVFSVIFAVQAFGWAMLFVRPIS